MAMKPLARTTWAVVLLFLLLGGTVWGQGAAGRDYYAPEVLDRPLGIQSLENGNVLITDAGGAFYTLTDEALLEVDPQGNVVWRYVGDMAFPHSANRLPDDTTLVSDTANDRVFRVDRVGEIVWSSDDWGGGTGTLDDGSHLAYPNDAELLENGNYLLTDRNNDRVLEVTASGQVIWQYDRLNRPHNADRLPNGNTLICNSEEDVVVEVDPAGDLVWSYSVGLHWPRDADRLENGNTLITDSRGGQVMEVTPEGDVIWRMTGLALPYEADRLANGNTLIADNNHKRVIEVDSGGEIVWQYRSFPDDYPDELQNGGFEEDSDGDGLPDGWYPADMNAEGPVTFVLDAGVVEQGQQSASILYAGEGEASWIQVVAVEPGASYRFSGAVRANLRAGVAAYLVSFLDDMGGPLGEPIIAGYVQGMSNWERVEVEATAPEGAASVQIWARLLQADGQAWFDDLHWEEADGVAWLPWVGAGVALVLLVLLVWGVLRRRRQA